MSDLAQMATIRDARVQHLQTQTTDLNSKNDQYSKEVDHQLLLRIKVKKLDSIKDQAATAVGQQSLNRDKTSTSETADLLLSLEVNSCKATVSPYFRKKEKK